jgi:hypothetical protein
VDIHLLKLQRLQSRILRAIRNLEICTSARELHVAFKISYVSDYITKLCSTQTKVILNHVNPNMHGIEEGEAKNRKYTWRRPGLRPFR